MEDKVLAWHWLRDNGCLQYPPHTKVEVGQTLTAEGLLELCKNGMHASLRALDALRYAPGAVICQVELSGEILEGDDKLCARHRKVLAMADATNTLHEFACWCAEEALLREREAGREPDQRSLDSIATKRKWLKGEATDKELAAARVASWVAARDAPLAAGRAAVEAAVEDAAWDVAWAARNAAEAAAWDDVDDAARDAAWDEQNAKLEEMLRGLLKEGEGKC